MGSSRWSTASSSSTSRARDRVGSAWMRSRAGAERIRERGDAAVAALLVNIDVEDLEKGIRFYSAGLGLKPGRRLGADACELLGASSPIYLLANQAGTRP